MGKTSTTAGNNTTTTTIRGNKTTSTAKKEKTQAINDRHTGALVCYGSYVECSDVGIWCTMKTFVKW